MNNAEDASQEDDEYSSGESHKLRTSSKDSKILSVLPMLHAIITQSQPLKSYTAYELITGPGIVLEMRGHGSNDINLVTWTSIHSFSLLLVSAGETS